LKDLIAHYRDFNTFYSGIKKRRNVMDFSDVILKTHELLKDNEEIRTLIGKRYRHIMLDEFQDTNPLRWDIVRMIFAASDKARLFIVGDRKQSIFRFANADVTVMNDAEKLVREEQGDILDFNDNYRSSRGFIEEGINGLMGHILKREDEEREPYEAFFEKTEYTAGKERADMPDPVEAHWCDAEDAGSDMYLPARHAAIRVKELLEKYEGSGMDPQDGKPLIGVILRRFTRISDYLQAFRNLNIPVKIIGGKGFYATPAVRDIFHFLSVLDNPYDDHALIGLLRSPFIGCSDPDIHLLTGREKNAPVFDAMQDHPVLRVKRDLIVSWIRDAGNKPLDELIAGILDSGDRELGYVGELMPEQQLANLDKALNMIRGMQRNNSSLRNIREFFLYQIKGSGEEGQALYPGTAKVHILTVHKAKGLEFPIVVLPEMNHSGSSSKDNIRLGRTGGHHEIALSLSDEDKPGILLRLKGIANLEERAEDRRIFYVALTRAIHKVLFLGEKRDKDYEDTWWNNYVLSPKGLKIKEPEDWPRDVIRQHSLEELSQRETRIEISEKEWIAPPECKTPGAYLYRSPHDLMGAGENEFDDTGGGLGTAAGSLYHYCMQRGWFDVPGHREDIDETIMHHFSKENKAELIAKVDALLETTRSHAVFDVLNDPGTEQYRELPVKAWLRRDKDMVQVNGTIDLLYRHKDRWILVDFKTDSTKNRLEAYKKQIQSYQWMLKQAFGLDAEGKIYFVSLNEMIRVDRNEGYFDGLPIGPGFLPAMPDAVMNIEPLLNELEHGPHLLFCASSQHEEQIYLGLVKAGRMRPDIRITTLSKWLRSANTPCTSQDRLRMMIQRADKNIKQGTADFLARAIRDHELGKGDIRAGFMENYRSIAATPAYLPADAAYKNIPLNNERIGFIDLPPPAPRDRELIHECKSRTTHFELSLAPRPTGGKLKYIEAFSPREETLAVARHIGNSANPGQNILIAVSSMDKYAPHLKRIFPQCGLQVRFTEPMPLLEAPCTGLLLDLLNIIRTPYPAWQDLAPVLLHPLRGMNKDLLNYDKKVRSLPLEEHGVPAEVRAFIETYSSVQIHEVKNRCERFIKDLHVSPVSGNEKVCRKFLDVLDTVIEDLGMIRADADLSLLYQEMMIRIKKESVPRWEQMNGIPVVGFLDSLGSVPDTLYVMGMVEGDIPRPENENPCLNLKEAFSLELNRHFMDHWISLGDRVVYSSSLHAEDGSEQNRSSFLEGPDILPLNAEKGIRRDVLLRYDNCRIREPERPLERRHNEIVSGEKGIYSGRVDAIEKDFHLSVTSVDALLACPMRFYYDKVLACLPLDTDEASCWTLIRGRTVHKILELFGKQGGFHLDIRDAIPLLQKNIDETFKHQRIDTEDPFQTDQFRDYVRDLNEGSGSNAFVIAIGNHQKTFGGCRVLETEKRFDDLRLCCDGVRVSLSGIMDKIISRDDGEMIVVSDYKTGTLNTSDMKKMLLSQLYLYAKKCRESYPDRPLMAAYEQIKDKDNTKIFTFTESNGNFEQLNSRNGNGFNIREFDRYLCDLFSRISEGKYEITERPFADACTHCPHEGLCRKGTRMHGGS
ncbi:MAG: PD-(D/E)XK nuclease family protein, partial [Candidatus Marinimicrobia bacterium]|nr:PD-(D/E)XK nuclease family protein [Candidatus Neomarinimicrobiota bacterium]